MNRTVIYTVLTGGYDRLTQPEVVRPEYDYVCFTDAVTQPSREGAWELRPIPFEDPSPVIRARFPKLQPHRVLPEYSWSVYHDANIRITGEGFYAAVEAVISAGSPYAALPHPDRDCVYEELRYCYRKDKIPTRAAFRHHRLLKAAGMPRHWGLYENNIIVRAHMEPGIIALDDAWWSDFFRGCCLRDQLTLTPALRRLDIHPALLFGPDRCARNVPFVSYTIHPRSGKENTPGRLTWGNVRYRIRLGWRKLCLLFLR